MILLKLFGIIMYSVKFSEKGCYFCGFIGVVKRNLIFFYLEMFFLIFNEVNFEMFEF